MTGRHARRGLLAAALGVTAFAVARAADPPDPGGDAGGAGRRVPLAVARDRARTLHAVYAATLDALHHHFFRRDRAVLPARAMEDVFADAERRTGVKARWVAVNTPAMSVPHEPATDFEKAAAAALAGTREEYERVENGYYLRAARIPLGAGCVGCHTRFALKPEKGPRFAGLVIAVPVEGR